jgi:predicted outer membrane repeat protein
MFPLIAPAATIVVTNNRDDANPGTLRNALANVANGDTINASGISGIITLTNGELLATNSVTIIGPGRSNLAVRGGGGSPVFSIRTAGIVTISGLTITHFALPGRYTSNVGRGIYNDHSTLTISNCTVSGNSDSSGGGIYNDGYNGSASLMIYYSTVSDNSADYGAGIYNDSRLSDSTTVKIYSSTVSGNKALDGNGGGILNTGRHGSGLGGQIEIQNSTFSGNSAAFSGGGIFNDGEQGSADLKIENSTFSGNSATYYGGAILNNGLTSGSATVEIGHTILSAGASDGTIVNIGDMIYNGATVTSLGYNLSTDDSYGFLTGPGDLIHTDPLLGPLAHNGGPTRTHLLWPGSPAIDAGDAAFTPPPEFDQRGPNFPRMVNGRIDIGAFEVSGQKPSHLNVMSQLEAIRSGVTNKTDAARLYKATRELASSLNATNWTDDSHLARPAGKQVFANDAITVKLLITLVTSKRSAFDTVDSQIWIYNLVFADRALTQTAITEATGDTTRAWAAFGKGNALASAGHPDKAIQAYAKAWRLVAPK